MLRDSLMAVRSSTGHVIGLHQSSTTTPLSPAVNREGTSTRPLRRRRTVKTARFPSPRRVAAPPAPGSDVCRPAAPPGATAMMDAGDEADDSRLIGDFTRPCRLPVVDGGKHADLHSVSPDTVLYDSYDLFSLYTSSHRPHPFLRGCGFFCRM